MGFKSSRQRKRVMGYELKNEFPTRKPVYNNRTAKMYGPLDGEEIRGNGIDSLSLDGVLYDRLPGHFNLKNAQRMQGMLIVRGDEAIVRMSHDDQYEVWVRSR